jgi:hypothetical protein
MHIQLCLPGGKLIDVYYVAIFIDFDMMQPESDIQLLEDVKDATFEVIVGC